MAFYHTYRPQQFSELVGQDHVRQTLQNALKAGKVSHGYLFTGPKGSGKTTTARLLAKAVNCQKPIGSIEPCNSCPICLDITAGKTLDVIEIDAASNRGIDEIRSLRDTLAYRPVTATKKVFIIDEVHMLTREAFNALLKTLEEPPDHILFIFATTEPHRVPETILSRVQRFDFHRASESMLISWLNEIAKKEQIKTEPDALSLIAHQAGGAYRDAAVLLEQVAAHGQIVSVGLVEKTIGLASGASIQQFANAIITTPNQQEIFTFLDQLLSQGIDISEFLQQLISYFRTQFRQGLNQADILILEELLQAQTMLRHSPIPQLPLELAIMTIRSKIGLVNHQPTQVSQTVTAEPKLNPPPQTKQQPDEQSWQQLLAELKSHNHSLSSILRTASYQTPSDSTMLITVPFKFHRDRIMADKTRQLIEKHASSIYGRPIKVECAVDATIVKKTTNNEAETLVAQAAEEIFG